MTWLRALGERLRVWWWLRRSLALLQAGREAEAEERARALSRECWCNEQLVALAKFWAVWGAKKSDERVRQTALLALQTPAASSLASEDQPREFARAAAAAGNWNIAAATFRGAGWHVHAARVCAQAQQWSSVSELLEGVAVRHEDARRAWLAAAARRLSAEALAHQGRDHDALIECERAANLALEALRERDGDREAATLLSIVRWSTDTLLAAKRGASLSSALLSLGNAFSVRNLALEAAVLLENAALYATTHAPGYAALLQRRAGEQWLLAAAAQERAGRTAEAGASFRFAAELFEAAGSTERALFARTRSANEATIVREDDSVWWGLLSDEAGLEAYELCGDALVWLPNAQGRARALQARIDASREDRGVSSLVVALGVLASGPVAFLLGSLLRGCDVALRRSVVRAAAGLPTMASRALARAALLDDDEQVRGEARAVLGQE